ncbi:C2 calcium-dependent domain-containing protein 4C [Stegastes partitus]|uniref:C2 calcium-dependent domain-containing protein 4C-like n=1 Tax=Stegastes partitus TaxID=144197 RepID=A0A3B4Z5J4_9TELE|nr:PREDICTED: C2 calcium-dependent domain-containing protein 4C-like [Stegastes partitus]XP_008292668.1 PREDICTED: C2 calcium-dependent domain-containing protein 4C-like [Stegastes partitus]
MWVLGKIKESMESIPLELSRYIGKSEEDIFFSSKTSFPQNLHSNILTPDKIPEFCLPPRLCKRSPLPETEKIPSYLHNLKQMSKSSTVSSTKSKEVKTKKGDESATWKHTQKPLPFSAEGYGLTGIYESLNTRRKESLFLSKRPVYMFDRSIPTAAARVAKQTNPPKKTSAGFFPLFSCKSLSETSGSPEGGTPSSSDSSPLSALYSAKFSLYSASSRGRLKGAVSCPSLTDSKEDRGRWRKVGMSLTTSASSPPTLEEHSVSPAPPVLLPLDVQREHVLPLQGRGTVHLLAEHATFPNKPLSSLSAVRVRVVSVEGVWDDADRQTLNCAVNLCLTPGKLQQQESATIRNCRSPVFNEDFFFTELSHKDLLELQLRLKVVNKAATGTLRRGAVIGVITKPLSQLLPLNKQVE